MRTMLCGMLLFTSMTAMSQATWADGFSGFYAAAKAGANRSSAFNRTTTSGFVGGELGYNVAVSPGMVLGVDVWGDNHRQSETGRDTGADLRLGNLTDDTLYYVKLGAANTQPGNRVHYGLGMEHLFAPHWGGLVEWTGDVLSKNSTTYRNNNLVVGLTFHL